MEAGIQTLMTMGIQYGVFWGTKLITFVVLLLVTFRVASWVSAGIRSVSEKNQLDPALARFFSSLGRYGILIVGVVVCLGTIGVETAGLAAVLAAAGFAVGLALQGTLGHFASGVMLLIFRPFTVGHVVSVGGITGKVIAIDLFSTILDTPDNRRIILPNGSVYGQAIENMSFHELRRADLAIGTAYDGDIDQARRVLMEAVQSIPAVLKDPAPAVVLTSLGASSVDWSVRAWVKQEDYWPTMDELARSCKMACDKADIGIPFPQLDVHFDGGPSFLTSAQEKAGDKATSIQ